MTTKAFAKFLEEQLDNVFPSKAGYKITTGGNHTVFFDCKNVDEIITFDQMQYLRMHAIQIISIDFNEKVFACKYSSGY